MIAGQGAFFNRKFAGPARFLESTKRVLPRPPGGVQRLSSGPPIAAAALCPRDPRVSARPPARPRPSSLRCKYGGLGITSDGRRQWPSP